MSTHRNKRALKVIRSLRQNMDKQSSKIDILCNDIVASHRDFVGQLENLTFMVRFYEAIIGQKDLTVLLETAAGLIKGRVSGANIAIFHAASDSFKLHIADDNGPIEMNSDKLESYFTSEVVNNVCRSNRVCRLEDMYEMGFQGNPAVFDKMSVHAIPLGRFGLPLGFILVYQSSGQELSSSDIETVTSLSAALSHAIEAMQNRTAICTE